VCNWVCISACYIWLLKWHMFVFTSRIFMFMIILFCNFWSLYSCWWCTTSQVLQIAIMVNWNDS
jgi:hypothetical protein